MISFVCPVDRSSLAEDEATLVCERGHAYAVVGGIPVLTVADEAPTHPTAWNVAANAGEENDPGVNEFGVDRFVDEAIVWTCGNLYRSLRGKVSGYPIPRLTLPPGEGRTLLDVGCNWGRWSIAAARAGYETVGVDPQLDAVYAARRIARRLEVDVRYAVADGRRLPFEDGSFDVVFSYGVLQHLDEREVRRSLEDFRRVLVPGGIAHLQFATAFGPRNVYAQARRRFRRPHDFEIRYWRPSALLAACREAIGPARLSTDGFFTLNPQAADIPLLRPRDRAVVRASEGLRRISTAVRPLTRVADSVYVTATRV